MSKRKILVSESVVEKRFTSQLDFLERSMRAYDEGAQNEVLRMAVTLRTLFHKTRNSDPLVEQIGLGDIYIESFANLGAGNLISEFGLTMWHADNKGTQYKPLLDQGPPIPTKMLAAQDWCTEAVIVLRGNGKEISLSRWDIILAMANQDGGAHSDPKGVAEGYHALVYENFGGFVFGKLDDNGIVSEETVIMDAEKATVRHIAWEAHKALVAEWNKARRG